MAQTVKNLPAMLETQVQFLGQEYPLDKWMATHASILAWEIKKKKKKKKSHGQRRLAGYSAWDCKKSDTT